MLFSILTIDRATSQTALAGSLVGQVAECQPASADCTTGILARLSGILVATGHGDLQAANAIDLGQGQADVDSMSEAELEAYTLAHFDEVMTWLR